MPTIFKYFSEKRKQKQKEKEEFNNKIQDKIIQGISEILKKPKETILPTSRIKEDLGADSLDAVELTMFLETEFEVEIPDEDADTLKTINDITDYLFLRRKNITI